jgi:quercetin dioxygenase-like cupin family protein
VRISRVFADGELVTSTVVDGVCFEAVEDMEGEHVEGVSMTQLSFAPNGAVHLVRVAAAGSMPMHTGPEWGFVQVVTGSGTLVLPGGTRVPYAAPELFLFEPNTLHSWTDVTADTLMSACIVG